MQKERQANGHTLSHTLSHTDTHRYTDTQIYRDRDRHTDLQTQTHTDTHTDKHNFELTAAVIWWPQPPVLCTLHLRAPSAITAAEYQAKKTGWRLQCKPAGMHALYFRLLVPNPCLTCNQCAVPSLRQVRVQRRAFRVRYARSHTRPRAHPAPPAGRANGNLCEAALMQSRSGTAAATSTNVANVQIGTIPSFLN